MIQGKGNCIAVAAALSLVMQPNMAHAGTGARPQASPASPVLPGDDKLTCPQILSEAIARNREFNMLLEEADRLKVPMSARTRALFVAHEVMASTLPMMGAGSDNIGTQAAAAASTNAYMESAHADVRKQVKPLEQRIDFAMTRGDYLNDLHRKKCARRASEPEDRSPGGIANCNARQAEIDRLRKQMEAGIASITGMAQSYKPGQAKAGNKVAGMAANLASSIVPGIGGLLGDAASKAASAAAKAEFDGFHGKLEGMAQEQALLGQKISDLELEYEEKCKR
jgi:hypothetical protein